ncbi:MAG: CoB--CoM heterodisulfide reductase iron-sulfur subunit B family protein [Anaerolineales bacterium]|jgi:heterodisulfide reductase subunit B
MKYSYFPGCSLEKNAAAYDLSTRAIAEPLGIELVEIEDWNCCGATEYLALNQTAAYSLIARNLAQAAKNEDVTELTAPCSACYLNLRKADKYLGMKNGLADRVSQALASGGLSYKSGTLHVRHLLDVIYQDVGLDRLSEQTTRPLYGLKVAPYYGCMIVRPDFGNGSQDPQTPTSLDRVLEALGAQVVDYPVKADCCGGHMTQISEDSGFELIRRLIKAAADAEADAIVTLCPMCQLNLDGFQSAMNRHFGTSYHVPVLYFTQVIGLAMGMTPRSLGIGQEIVSAVDALAKIGSEPPPEPPKPVRRKRDDKSLPMPAARVEA